MDEPRFPRLLDLLEDRHREAGHGGSFQGCTVGECPELRHELDELNLQSQETALNELLNARDKLNEAIEELELCP